MTTSSIEASGMSDTDDLSLASYDRFSYLSIKPVSENVFLLKPKWIKVEKNKANKMPENIRFCVSDTAYFYLYLHI